MNKKQIQEKSKVLSKNKSVKIYKKVLNGKMKKFPDNYWRDCSDKKYDGSMCVRYMVEVILRLDESKYKDLSKRQIREYKLDKMLDEVFGGSVFEVVNYLYPGKYFEWTFEGKNNGYWSKEKVVQAVRFIFEANGWGRDDIKKEYDYRFIVENGLEYAVKKFYDNKVYDLLTDACPNENFKAWELKSVPRSYWTKETGISATMWMVNKLGWSRNDIKKMISKDIFKEMGLGGMLKILYNNSIYEAINDAYPGEFKRYEFGVSKGYWTHETTIIAIRDMVKDLGYGKEEIKYNLSRKHFRAYKLDYPVQKVFEGSYYDAINTAYKGEFKKYELKNFRYKKMKMNKIAESVLIYEY